ncbi:uncharacterized protein LOC126373340 isoform X3 [Pectinophora gossypiella]|nr:uncharacterized protein LOC126373340 isoform X3 [Pectinophora gossypiella]
MWKFVSVFLLLELWRTAEGAVAILPPQAKPAKYADLKGCYIPDFDLVLPYDTPYSPRNGIECTQYTCKTNGYTNIFSCGAIGVGEGCTKVPGDKTLAYPDCCDSIKCDETSLVESIPEDNTPEDNTTEECTNEDSAPENISPENSPVESTPVESAPVETSPVETSPVETPPVEPSPVENKAVETTPDENKITKGPIRKLPPIKIPLKDPCAPIRRKCPRGLICIDDPVAS